MSYMVVLIWLAASGKPETAAHAAAISCARRVLPSSRATNAASTVVVAPTTADDNRTYSGDPGPGSCIAQVRSGTSGG
jgi:hypothetical protein